MSERQRKYVGLKIACVTEHGTQPLLLDVPTEVARAVVDQLAEQGVRAKEEPKPASEEAAKPRTGAPRTLGGGEDVAECELSADSPIGRALHTKARPDAPLGPSDELEEAIRECEEKLSEGPGAESLPRKVVENRDRIVTLEQRCRRAEERADRAYAVAQRTIEDLGTNKRRLEDWLAKGTGRLDTHLGYISALNKRVDKAEACDRDIQQQVTRHDQEIVCLKMDST